MSELLIGAGSRRTKRFMWGDQTGWSDLTTLDMNADHNPDVVWNLETLPLPFEDNTFNEIHAYQVLEHVGQQGDWFGFFEQFSEFWRILKPGGVLCGTSPSPSSPWVWGDPGHTRALSIETFTFLCQDNYDKQVGVSPMTDYRFIYKADFRVTHYLDNGGDIEYVLQAVKPSRCSVG